MEREVGGGIGMGNTCRPMAVSFQCMTKFTTKKKKTTKHSIKFHRAKLQIAHTSNYLHSLYMIFITVYITFMLY